MPRRLLCLALACCLTSGCAPLLAQADPGLDDPRPATAMEGVGGGALLYLAAADAVAEAYRPYALPLGISGLALLATAGWLAWSAPRRHPAPQERPR